MNENYTIDEMRSLIGPLFDTLVEQRKTLTGMIIEKTLGIPPAKMLLTDLLEYYSYLAAADGDITFREVLVINSLCDCNTTIEDIQRQVLKYRLVGREYRNAVPHTLTITMTIDEELIKEGTQENPNLTIALLNIYKYTGYYYIVRTGAWPIKEGIWREYVFYRVMDAGKKFSINFQV